MLLPLLLALTVHAAPAADSTSRLSPDGAAWTPIVAFDEVRVDADTARVAPGAPFTLWLRWSYLDRASSPQAWDAGARGSFDLVEIDCARAATRTFSSFAFSGTGSAVPEVSFEDPMAQWRVARSETVAGMIAGQLCGLAATKR